ncbi:MAG: GntR family transcriptional regulator [Mesorhizobium sp.]|nr:GntR family transcriptional regulator [Mesorhizobium sp.]RWB03234.1 MAG: GntR family transcriptional regulator [Mesorhizobium sp.]RWB17167.1 MAG: GntR family transcriptional regulator [Mesorhizobium sp.]
MQGQYDRSLAAPGTHSQSAWAQFFERIQVGERINEAEVAATLGVSRTPVPHALVQLQARRGRKLRAQPRLSIARSDPAGRSPRWDRFLSTRQ